MKLGGYDEVSEDQGVVEGERNKETGGSWYEVVMIISSVPCVCIDPAPCDNHVMPV
jgi:hypothetical protein